jgi:hypothetical protein
MCPQGRKTQSLCLAIHIIQVVEVVVEVVVDDDVFDD